MVSSTKINDVLWQLENKIYSRLENRNETEIAITPLRWYIFTGRAPTVFLERLLDCNNRQLSTIGNRLIKSRTYDNAINSIYQYLGLKRG